MIKPNLTFTRIQQAHISGILAIEQESFPDPWSRAMFEREIILPLSRFYVAHIKERMVGYGGFWIIHDEAHIVNLAVHPEWRRYGIGREILSYLIYKVQQTSAQVIELEVRESNEPARALYASFGFDEIGFRPEYYGTEGAVLMEKQVGHGDQGLGDRDVSGDTLILR